MSGSVRSDIIQPTWPEGFATSQDEAEHPDLWDGLVAAYSMGLGPTGNTLWDVVGGNDGTLTNGPTWGVADGRYALDFDGTDDYCTISASNNPLNGLAVGTVSIWFECDDVTQNTQYSRLLSNGVNDDFELATRNSLLYAFVRETTTTHTGWNSLGTITNGVWHHAVVVLRSDGVYGYLDGVETLLSSNIPTGGVDGVLNIGDRFDASGEAYNGRVDGPLIYNRASNASEVRKLYDLKRGAAFQLKRRFTGFSPISAALTGTATASIDEDDVSSDGTKTIVFNLTGSTFKAAGTGPIGTIAQSQAFVDNITNQAASPANGWNNEVNAVMDHTDITRDSDTQATVTIPVVAAYDISAQETITGVVPTDVLVTGGPITASPTFTVDFVSAGGVPAGSLALMGVGT